MNDYFQAVQLDTGLDTRSRLYRSQMSYPNSRWKALDEIYQNYICVFGEKRTEIENKIMNMCNYADLNLGLIFALFRSF